MGLPVLRTPEAPMNDGSNYKTVVVIKSDYMRETLVYPSATRLPSNDS